MVFQWFEIELDFLQFQAMDNCFHPLIPIEVFIISGSVKNIV